MEVHFVPNYNYSLLGQYENIFSSACEKCSDLQEKYYKLDKKVKYSILNCEICKEKKKLINKKYSYYLYNSEILYIGILVTIVGNPAPPPTDCTYVIKIWQIKENEKSSCKPINLTQDESPIEFSFSSSVKGCDLDHTKKIYIQNFYKYLVDIQESNYSFKGKSSKGNYIKELKDRMNKLLSSKERETQSQCPHISKRKKGYSRYK